MTRLDSERPYRALVSHDQSLGGQSGGTFGIGCSASRSINRLI